MSKGKLYWRAGITPNDKSPAVIQDYLMIGLLDEAMREFPKPSEFPYETTVESRDLKYQSWLEKWFGDRER